MAINLINIGNAVNDGLGDDLRTAFQKVNANFADLDGELSVTAVNIGTGKGIFAQKVGKELQFKTLIEGPNVSIQTDTNQNFVRIGADVPRAFVRIDTEEGVVLANSNTSISVRGGNNLSTSSTGNVITVDTKLDIGTILTFLDFGDLDGTYDNIIQTTAAFTNYDFGTIARPGNISLNLGEL